jgi:hypothetical protein
MGGHQPKLHVGGESETKSQICPEQQDAAISRLQEHPVWQRSMNYRPRKTI